uniref:Uncharacterized protein n=1 Tax=Nelumbo nucifera TaxID=4432 RepID=A0A822YC38_NELNU|nr:TPA_asm: hypothetical protein HUJ06_030104 [Nelumbo nucifera]
MVLHFSFHHPRIATNAVISGAWKRWELQSWCVEEVVVMVEKGKEESMATRKVEAILALAEIGRSLDSTQLDLASAVEAGRIIGEIVFHYFDSEKSLYFSACFSFGGFPLL